MTFLTKPALIGALFAIIGTQSVFAQTIKVAIAAEPYPPFASVDASGKWQGWEVDMIGAICETAKLDCKITPIAWDGIIPALNSKKVDMIMASLSITPARLKAIDFSDKYYSTPAVIIGDKNVEIGATAASMKGKILGVQSGTTNRKYALKYFADTADTIKEYQTQDEVNQDLIAGRIDALQADSVAMLSFINSAEGKMCCEVKGEVADDPEIFGPGVGAGMRKGDDALRTAVNSAIKTLRENGRYQAISKKYFDFDPYGQ